MMDILPMGIIVLLWVTSPEYFKPFFDNTLMTIVFWGLIGFTVMGSWVIRRTVKRMKDDSGV